MMTNRTIEVVIFKLAKGISEMEFLKTVPPTIEFVKARQGFVSRRLSKNDDGTWVDHIEWETMDAAKQASEAFMYQKDLMPFMNAIDMETTQMMHNELKASVG